MMQIKELCISNLVRTRNGFFDFRLAQKVIKFVYSRPCESALCLTQNGNPKEIRGLFNKSM